MSAEMDMAPSEASKTRKRRRQSESGDEDGVEDNHRPSFARQMTVRPGCPPSDSDSGDGISHDAEVELDKDDERGPTSITSSLAEPSSGPIPDLNLSPQRRALYQALVEKLEQVGTTTGQWPSQTMAVVKSEQQDILASIGMLLVMDEEEFEFWASLYGEAKLADREAHWDVKYPAKARQVLETWVQRRRLVYEESLDLDVRENQRHALGRTKESVYLAELTVREWYKGRCVVTGCACTKAFPIFPDFLTEDDKDALWDALSWFWPSKSVQDWRKAVDEPGHETNLLIIGEDNNYFWADAQLAFRPLQTSDDGHEICLQFFWLSHTLSHTEILEYEDPDPSSPLFYSVRSDCGRPILSGAIMNIRSVDTAQYSLPNFALVELQWHLNRAMRAAANPKLLEILFDDNGYDDGTERDSYKPTPCDPCARHTPWFSDYLIEEERIIRPQDVSVWEARLDPDGQMRDGGRLGTDLLRVCTVVEYIFDHNTGEWKYVVGYDQNGNRGTIE